MHTVTYFLAGLLAIVFLNYSAKYADPAITILMRQTNDPLVAADPLFQVVRGALFGIVVSLLHVLVLERKRGWLTMWALLVIVCIVSPFGVVPASNADEYTVKMVVFGLKMHCFLELLN